MAPEIGRTGKLLERLDESGAAPAPPGDPCDLGQLLFDLECQSGELATLGVL